MNEDISNIIEKLKNLDNQIKLLIKKYEERQISKEEYFNKRYLLEKEYSKLSNELARIKFIGIKKRKNNY
jgi:pyruvate-formate lyase-activating enzyme